MVRPQLVIYVYDNLILFAPFRSFYALLVQILALIPHLPTGTHVTLWLELYISLIAAPNSGLLGFTPASAAAATPLPREAAPAHNVLPCLLLVSHFCLHGVGSASHLLRGESAVSQMYPATMPVFLGGLGTLVFDSLTYLRPITRDACCCRSTKPDTTFVLPGLTGLQFKPPIVFSPEFHRKCFVYEKGVQFGAPLLLFGSQMA
ncbi:hypothetical protein DFH06DRAFT_1299585 [Mycena polygramma]|nr:hypothetical protein DFH06DRAFT_1299585 [Mycena polygramma]